MKLFGIIGAGGFSREVMPLADAMLKKRYSDSNYQLVFVDENIGPETIVNQHRVISLNDFMSHSAKEKYFNIAIAKQDVRQRIAESMILNGIVPFSIRAENSIELANNQIDEGAIFCPFTMVTSNVKIGKFFHANIYSYVAHDCIIGDYVTFAPNVHCNGGVIIEDGAYLGTGVIIKQGTQDRPIVIGQGAVCGMGAVITKSVPPFETVVGNPAKALVVKDMING